MSLGKYMEFLKMDLYGMMLRLSRVKIPQYKATL
jgi:hypothetical protein